MHLPNFNNVLFASVLASAFASSVSSIRQFHPEDYGERNVACPAIDRREVDNEKTVEINMNYVEINQSYDAKGVIMMVHGWPAIWSTWARQIDHFKDRYHLLVPNLRGFYKSTHPGDVETGGTYGDMIGDLVCVMDNAGVSSVVCMGHDWGSQLCFEAARQRPDRFHAVIALAVPYVPSAGPFLPTAHLAKLAPKLAYQEFFNSKTHQALKELDASVRRTIRATLRGADDPPPAAFLTSTETFWGEWDSEELLPVSFLASHEEDYLVAGLELQGFKNTLQFYLDGNRKLSHAHAQAQGNHTIHSPALLILPSLDRVANWRDAMKIVQTEKFTTQLTIQDVEAAHWPQLEAAETVNSMIDQFLAKIPGSEREHSGREERVEL